MTMTSAAVDITYTMSETAKLLKCSRPKLYDLIHEGRLITYTLGRRRYVAHDDLLGCIANLRESSGGG